MDAQQLKEWLSEQLDKRPEKSKAELAKALNLEPPAVSKILNGTRQIKAIEYVRILEFLGVSANEHGLPSTPSRHEQDVFDGMKEEQRTKGEWSIPQEILSRPNEGTSDGAHKAFCINDCHMEPAFKQGEHVMVDCLETLPSNAPKAFLVSDGYNRMVRLCRSIPDSQPRTIEITATSKSFEPQQLFEKDFEIIGKVVAKVKWL